MNKTIRVAVALCFVCSLSSCRSLVLDYDTLRGLQKGMTREQTATVLGISSTHAIRTKEYSAYKAYLYKTETMEYHVKDFVSNTRTIFITIEPLICLYKDERLVYWGFLYDYNRSDEPEIASIAPVLTKEISALNLGNE